MNQYGDAGEQVVEISFITEGDVYRLIVHSKLPSAERFEHWVFDEVLPSIRKHGVYMSDSILDQVIQHPEVIYTLAQELVAEREQLEGICKQLNAAQPKADYFDTFVNSEDCTCIRNFCKEIGIPEKTAVALLLDHRYLSQKYALEDMVLKKYPEAITRLTERIAGYEQDVQLAAAHPKPQEGFVGITILDQPYADKEAAGKAILDVCTRMTGSDAGFLGQYRGVSLVLSYDGPSNEYRMTMKGTLSQTAVLGTDVFGNLTRMDNVLDGLSSKLEAVRAELADT